MRASRVMSRPVSGSVDTSALPPATTVRPGSWATDQRAAPMISSVGSLI